MYILVNVPYSSFFPAPLIGIPHLLGILDSNKIQNELIDINAHYYKYLFSQTGISDLIRFFNHIANIYENKNPKLLKQDKKLTEILKDNNYRSHNNFLYYIKQRIDFCTYVLKSKNLFYNISLATHCRENLDKLADTAYAVHYKLIDALMPGILQYRTFFNEEKFKIDVNLLQEYFDSDFFVFKDFYQKKADEILSKNPNMISISINHQLQTVSGLYLCYLLKKKSNVHINIGGFFFSQFYKIIENLAEVINTFCNSISVENNTGTITELADYVNNKINLCDIGNIIYVDKKTKKLRINLSENKIKFKDFPFQSFEGFEKSNYIHSELVLPIQVSRSCYWKKCIFCGCADTVYEIKPLNKIIDEIEYLSSKYGTKYFYFWDNALHPKTLEKLADILIKKKLNIKYSVFARFEQEFSLKLLKKIHKSGCQHINWGLDSANEKILKIINKGITLQNAERIIKESNKAGIFNTVYLILGHPEETIDDLEKDYQFVKRNNKYMNCIIISPSVLFFEGSIIYKEREKYRSQIVTTPEEREIYLKKMMQLKDYNSLFILSIYITLYMAKKGLKNCIKDMKLINKQVNHLKLYLFYVNCHVFIFNLNKKLIKLLKKLNCLF